MSKPNDSRIPDTAPDACDARGPTRPSSRPRGVVRAARRQRRRRRLAADIDARPARATARPAPPARGRSAGSVGSAGAGGSGSPTDQPASIYRADRRTAARRERGDLELVAASDRRRRFHWWYLLAIPLALLVALGVWGFLGYSTFNKAVAKSNHRVGKVARAALVRSAGRHADTPTTLLVLGGTSAAAGLTLRQHPADALRPEDHTVSQLSIPRRHAGRRPRPRADERQRGHSSGARTPWHQGHRQLHRRPVTHVMVAASTLPDLINSVGGVVINVPHDLPRGTQATRPAFSRRARSS